MANIGHVMVEVRPTVTLESAVACVMMLNLFLNENEDYRLKRADGEWHLTDEPVLRGSIHCDKVDGYFGTIPNESEKRNEDDGIESNA